MLHYSTFIDASIIKFTDDDTKSHLLSILYRWQNAIRCFDQLNEMSCLRWTSLLLRPQQIPTFQTGSTATVWLNCKLNNGWQPHAQSAERFWISRHLVWLELFAHWQVSSPWIEFAKLASWAQLADIRAPPQITYTPLLCPTPFWNVHCT